MEGGSLFNAGFLGGSFLWWVGQVADDRTWRENINPQKFKNPSTEIPGWGYRYKVRIIGMHDQEESTLSADQLPWAQVMYPVTAGGGQGGSYQTPAIKQGNFVFGFFLDGQDQQVPVIIGVLGNNAQTSLSLSTSLTGGKNYTPQSGFSNSSNDDTKKVADNDLATVRPSENNSGGNNPNNPPVPNKSPTKETPSATNQETSADIKKGEVLRTKHALANPDPSTSSEIKGIQTVIDNLTKKIQKIQKALQRYADAVSLPIKNAVNDLQTSINKFMEDASREISKFMKDIFTRVQNFVTDQYNKKLKPILKNSPVTFLIDLLNLKVKGLESIVCLFNSIYGKLKDMIGNFLKKSFNNRKNQANIPTSAIYNTPRPDPNAPPTPEATIIQSPSEFLIRQESDVAATSATEEPKVPPLPIDGYGTPTPICTAEELVAQILGETINPILQVFDSAVKPIVVEVSNAITSADSSEVAAVADAVQNLNTINSFAYTITQDNVNFALKSGDLVNSMSDTLASKGFRISSNFIGPATQEFQNKNYASGLVAMAGASLAKNQANQPGVGAYRNGLIQSTQSSNRLTTLTNVVALNLFGNNVPQGDIVSTISLIESYVNVFSNENEDSSTRTLFASTNENDVGDVLQKALTTVLGSGSGAYLAQTDSLISSVRSISNGDLIGGFTALSSSFGLNSDIASTVADAFSVISSGDIGLLTYKVGILSRLHPQILDSVLKNVVTFDFINPNVIQSFGNLAGLDFDIASALQFISSLTTFFDCDPRTNPSVNDTHTLQEGGNGKPGVEKPNPVSIAQKAYEKSLSTETGGGSFLTGAGTESESKQYNIPSNVG